ncbi:dTDP-glucose 4,6-dehydratase [Geomicrobium sp. JCM 19039]|uniref:dTDP-glucose 4,6-dehydratase n=1 Tax=Geomicrobium sp. JCM 19039 TaxID=1460636 RepID=UPI00045F1315|nr:GDP-mannose 4,6-dehydratase [Geomicrobium sp. JCM 19039]GAK11814.1 UDP-glucose 4-epimerase [Geomicrobium sp. JCM 19039]
MKRAPIKGKNILIVGGAGFIGSHLVDRLLDDAAHVVIMDNLFIGQRANIQQAIKRGATFVIDDAENQEALEYLIEKYETNIVFNCATKALNYSFMNPANAYLTNVFVIKSLLELQRKQAFETLCHFSSSEAYGTAQYEPMDEQHPLLPTTTYAAGKAAADLMIQSYVQMFDLDAFIVRPFNNYGPRQNADGPLAGVIPLTIRKILLNEAPEIHGSGKQTRDFVYVKDTVQLVLNVYEKIDAGETVNITTDQQLSIEEVIQSIAKVMNYTGQIETKPDRKADVRDHRGSRAKLKAMIGDYEKTTFQDGIKACADWVKKHT